MVTRSLTKHGFSFRRALLFLVFAVLTGLPAFCQWTELVVDSFTGQRPVRYDLSTKLLWGGQTQPVSALLGDSMVQDATGLAFHAQGITPQARAYAQFSSPTGLKTHIAIDYPLPIPINRNLDTIRITADFLWETLLPSGESGRFVMALLHDYPEGGPKFGDVDSVNAHHPYGRPAYNVRIMNKNGVMNFNLNGVMMYGGGNSRLGDFEVFRQANNKWWLPGFITEPGGTAPGSTGTYPTGGSAQLRNQQIASTTNWRRFTWTLFPEQMKLEVRNTADPESANTTIMQMFIPSVDTLDPAPGIAAINAFYNSSMVQLPRLYYWFPQIEAFRFFWNAGSNVWLANLKLETTGNTTATRTKMDESNPYSLVPNPGRDLIHIRNWKGSETIRVVNTQGREMTIGTERKTDGKIDTTSWPEGLYFVRIQHKGKAFTLRWVKQ